MKVFIAAAADRDLMQIDSYLADRSPSAADAMAAEFARKFESLAHFPFIGRERASLGQGLRSLVAGNHVIFYSVDRERVTIVRVLDGRRDIDEEFRR